MRQLLLTILLLVAVVVEAKLQDDYESVPFLNPVKRSFNRVVLRPMDFLHHKRMVSFNDAPSRSALLDSLLNGGRY